MEKAKLFCENIWEGRKQNRLTQIIKIKVLFNQARMKTYPPISVNKLLCNHRMVANNAPNIGK